MAARARELAAAGGRLKRFNIVVVFDAIGRPDTTGRYVLAALRQLGHLAWPYDPIYRNRARKMAFKGYSDLLLDGADLLLYVDDDIGYPVAEARIPRAYWCIDTHRMDRLIGGGTRWERVKRFDHVFYAQRDRAQELGGTWLPLACDPGTYRPLDLEKRYDWCFVGNVAGERQALLEAVRAEIPNGFIGNAYFAEANRIYNQSWLALNPTIGNDINMRFFEAQATSALMLASRCHNGEADLFAAAEHFDDAADCVARMRGWLADKPAARARALKQAADMRRHTYAARMAQAIDVLANRLGAAGDG